MQNRRMESTGSTSKSELKKAIEKFDAQEETKSKEIGAFSPEMTLRNRRPSMSNLRVSVSSGKGKARFFTQCDAPSNSQ